MGAVALRVRSWLRANAGVAGLLVVVVAVVGGITLALVAGAVRTATVVERNIDASPFRHDVDIEQFGGPPAVDEIRALPAVEHAEMATFFFGAVTPVGELVPADGIVFLGTSIEPFGAEGLLEGRMPSGEDPGEFVATPSYAANLGAEVGDRFDLITISQGQADRFGFDAPPDDLGGPVVPATLVGIIDQGAAALQSEYPMGYFDRAVLDEGDIGVAAGEGIVDLAAGATIDDLRAQLDELDNGDDFGLAPAEPIDEDIRTAVDAQAQGVLVLAVIVGVTAIVVLGQLLSRQFRLSDGERTVLEAVGCTPGQVVADPLTRAAVVVGAGSALAIVVAVAASGIFPIGFSRTVEPDPGPRFDPLTHLVGPVVFVALVLGLVALLLGAQRSRPTEPVRSTFVDRIVTGLPDIKVATAMRFAFGRGRRAGSTGASLAGLVLVMALVVAAVTFGSNLTNLLDEPERYGDIFDLGIGQGGDRVPPGVLDTLEESSDVAAVTLFGATTVSVGSESLGIVAFEPVVGHVVPEVLEGRLPRGDDEIALGSHVAEALGVGVGDDFDVSGASDAQTFHVVGIAIIGGIEESDVAGQNGLVTTEGLLRIDPDDAMSSVGIDLDPAAPSGAQERLEDALGLTLGPTDRPVEVSNLDRVRAVPFAVAALVGVLAALTLGHLLLVGVRRRGRDLAVIRACGATSRWVGAVVHWQATLTTVFAIVVAIPVGVAAGTVLYRPYADGIGARTDVTVPFVWFAAALAVLVVLANVVAAVPVRSIRRRSPADALTRA